MIYYHAAIHKENDNDELRFKKLIEKTGFFHNMEKNLIVDLDKNGQQFLTRYDVLVTPSADGTASVL